MHTTQATTFRAASLLAILGVAGFLTSQLVPSVSGPVGAASVGAASAVAAVAKSAAAGTRTAAAAVAAVAASPVAPPAVALATPVARAAIKFATDEALRAQMKWVPVRYGGEKTQTLDEASRLLLAQAAAEKAGLQQVGLSFQDVYGVIQAETSWIPRHGKGKNGVTSLGLAQFEPRTARGLGLKDPHDPVQAVYAAAVNMKHGAEWAEDRIAHLQLTPEQRAEKIREGVSIYYNLSVKGRNKWDGINTTALPIETQRHIRNSREGAEKAAELADDLLG
jgi:soluble lytic murein transglycosylase-like protein